MFKYYGIGVVITDNSEGNKEIDISPVEIIRDMKGLITNMSSSFDSSIGSSDGSKRSIAIEADYVIKANWFSLNSNRSTPPYVVKGEEVVIVTIPNTDIYFWLTSRGHDDLRKQEKVTYVYSNKLKAKEMLTIDNSIEITIDTIKKNLSITTPINDEEPMTWEIKLDYLNAVLSSINSQGDQIIQDGLKRHVQVTTTTVEIDAKDTTITGNLLVKKNVVILGTLAVTLKTTLKNILKVIKDITGKNITASGKMKQGIPKREHGKDHLH